VNRFRTVEKEIPNTGCSFRMRRHWRLWRHEYDVIESCDVVDDVTNRRAVGTFLNSLYWTWSPKWLTSRDI